MWYDEVGPNEPWSALWKGYIVCGTCSGIRHYAKACPTCGAPPPTLETRKLRLDDGSEVELAPAFMGAEGRYEDWIYLRLLEREWKRPLSNPDEVFSFPEVRTSPRAAIVLLFWTYFETRIDRLIRAGMTGIPESIQEDMLRRYSFIGARLRELYHIVFGSTYERDLDFLGYSTVKEHLRDLRERRNRFMHGEPGAVDDQLVTAVVEMLKIEHEAWIAIFNLRVANRR